MRSIIEELVDEIKKDQRYIDFINHENKLKDKDVHSLLIKYHELVEEYTNLNKYSEYIDNTKLEDELKNLKKEISLNKVIKEYYQSYHALNELLEQVTSMVFVGISEDLSLSRYKI